MQKAKMDVRARLDLARKLVSRYYFGEQPLVQSQGEVFASQYKCLIGSQFTLQAGGAVLAQARATLAGGVAFPLAALQALTGSEGALARLERTCHTLHVINYFIARERSAALTLPLGLRLAQSNATPHDERFCALLDALGIARSQLVIQLPAGLDGRRAAALAERYQSLGFAVCHETDPCPVNDPGYDMAALRTA